MKDKRRHPQRSRATRQHLLLGAGSIALTFLLLEGGMALCDQLQLFPRFYLSLKVPYYPFNSKTGEGLYYAHPYFSYDMKPGYRASSVTINALGFRGREVSAHKVPGTYRIVALGGSTTYGIYLADDETYPASLDAILKERLGAGQVEVINAGLVSATTTENLIRFLLKIVPLEPDLVLLYQGFNDLLPRVFNDFADDYSHFRRSPYKVSHVLEQSYLYRLLDTSLSGRFYSDNRNLIHRIWRFENLPNGEQQKLANFRRSSSAVFQRNLESMIQAARARDIEVVLATFAFNDEAPNWNRDLPDALWAEGIGDHNRVIRELAERYDVPLVPFYEYGLAHPAIFYDSIHMTADGNRQMAALIADTILPIVKAKMR